MRALRRPLVAAALLGFGSAWAEPAYMVVSKQLPACVEADDMQRVVELIRAQDLKAAAIFMAMRAPIGLCMVIEPGHPFELLGPSRGRPDLARVRPKGDPRDLVVPALLLKSPDYGIQWAPMGAPGGLAGLPNEPRRAARVPPASPGVIGSERGIRPVYPQPPARQLLDAEGEQARAAVKAVTDRPCVDGGSVGGCVAMRIESPDVHRPDWTVALQTGTSTLLVERLGRIGGKPVRWAWEVAGDGSVRPVSHHAAQLDAAPR